MLSILAALLGIVAACILGASTVRREECRVYVRHLDTHAVWMTTCVASFLLFTCMMMDVGAEFVAIAELLVPARIKPAFVAFVLLAGVVALYAIALVCFSISAAYLCEQQARLGAALRRARCSRAKESRTELLKVREECPWRNPDYCAEGVDRPVMRVTIPEKAAEEAKATLAAQCAANELQCYLLSVTCDPDYSDKMSWRSLRKLDRDYKKLNREQTQVG